MFTRLVIKTFLIFIIPGIFITNGNSQCVTPGTPVIQNITQPTCNVTTGSIEIGGLPGEGTWTLTRYPDEATISGTGTTFTDSELPANTYSFTVTILGCTSERSADAVITAPPATPAPPVITGITQPTCTTSTGSITLGGLPENGTWTIDINPGNSTLTGSGTTATLTGLEAGRYSFRVTNADGCRSRISADAVVNSQPSTPSAPVINTVTQPSCETPAGSVALSGLPGGGTWTLTRYPGAAESTGSGSAHTVSGLDPGIYYFTVTNAGGCTSGNSSSFTINDPPALPSAPSVTAIVQPTCEVSRGSVSLEGLPASGTWVLSVSPGSRTVEGSGGTATVTDLEAGNYTFRVTNSDGCRSAASPVAVIDAPPVVPASPVHRIDCFLGNGFAVVTVLSPVETGFEYRIDNGPFLTTRTFMEIGNGSHTISVRSSGGCITTGNPFTVSCGCVNRPSVTLSSITGTACGINPVTITGNTFGGSATSVTITENGAGSVTPSATQDSPFSFTYTPVTDDAGKTVVITITTDNPLGEPCGAASATYVLNVAALPSSPVVGEIQQAGCTSITGSVSLSGLPSAGRWILIRNPGNVSTEGNGATTTVTGLESGTYTFSVTSNGCTSLPSSAVVINSPPAVPAAPATGELIHPTCTVPTGTVNLTGLPAEGIWTLTRYPGTITTSGTGTIASIPGLPAGTYNFTVTNAAGCVSALSSNIIVNIQPPTPTAPAAGSVTAPTCVQPVGTVMLTGLPATGSWTINSVTGGVTLNGSGQTTTIGGLSPGGYSFTVTNPAGCTSAASNIVLIPEIPDAPVLIITDPVPACAPATIDITSPSVTAGSTAGLTYSYWLNQAATAELSSPTAVTTGIYYIKGTNAALCYDIKPVHVSVFDAPLADAGPDQLLDYTFITTVSAVHPDPGVTGSWTVFSGTGTFTEPSSPVTTVSGLVPGENIFLWTVTNGVCPQSTDTLIILVKDLNVPTLITPNDDGINDNFILNGIETLPRNELLIFDRRGVTVFRDNDYNNDWNGVDYNGRPLADDTYFYVLKTGDGRQRSGFIIIRR